MSDFINELYELYVIHVWKPMIMCILFIARAMFLYMLVREWFSLPFIGALVMCLDRLSFVGEDHIGIEYDVKEKT